ncbi:unnamed protein product [Arctia plantaginis]|uniref:Glucose-methanol-choline oxidoreductase N-terminal domain-containing protein n=1 Tax=Arctia plantaginis TaxID=874455 RepID=A0A8S0ZIE2_ARCPL|nr:unnamed protein product [Arctia plantaginis]
MDAIAVQLRTKFIQMGLRMIVLLQLTSYLWPQDTPLKDVQPCYDFIIVGCGTAGSILANRLSASGQHQVLVIEAGGDPPMESLYAGTFLYLKNSQYDWNFTTVNDGFTAQAHRNNILTLTSGKMLGGSSSLGHLLYLRGDPTDYNRWADIVKDQSWNYEHLIKYFRKSEMLDFKDMYTRNNLFHGTDGPMGVTKIVNHVSQKYLHIFKQAGHEIIKDGNTNMTLGYFEPMFMSKDGIRQSVTYTYLTPIKNRPNLHFLKEAEVIDIKLNKDKAVGVTVIKNNDIIRMKANREIILSAGAIKTPQLLMLSGIGLSDHLSDHGIEVKKHLPVGKFYQDHLEVTVVHKLNVNNQKSFPADPHEFPASVIVGNVAVDKGKRAPDYQSQNFIIPSDSDSLLTICSVENAFINDICESIYNKTKGYETMLSKIIFLRPKAKGHVVLQSADYKDNPLIISGFYSHDIDVDTMSNYIIHFLQLSKTPVFKQFGGDIVFPTLPECDNYPGITYWKCYALNMMGSSYDYTGTCSMGSVVDRRLRVMGVGGLRVVDASVIPVIPSGSIQAAVMAIAEKGADMILKEVKNKSPSRCNPNT